MSIHIQNTKPDVLSRYFFDKKCWLDKPFLFAIDCDRTIVDRKASAHFVSQEVIQMFQKLHNDPRFIVVINTGRDFTNYHPIQIQLSHAHPCLFLSGRVLKLSSETYTLPMATIRQPFCSIVWKKFIQGAIPFLDVKHEEGHIHFALKNREMKKYYGLYKPLDWFNSIECLESDQEGYFHALKIVRFELPFLRKDHPEIVEAIEKQDKRETQLLVSKFFQMQDSEILQFIPVLVHPSRKELRSEIAFCRAMISSKYVNKGTGIKTLIEKLSIPQRNVICFGDSAGDTASDSAIKLVLPEATLLITEDGDPHAIEYADFLIKGVAQNGVPEAVSYLIQALDHFKIAS